MPNGNDNHLSNAELPKREENKPPNEAIQKKYQKKPLLTGRDLRASSLGWEIAIPIGVGPLIGFFIDQHFNTGDFFTLTLLGLGVLLAVLGVLRFISEEFEIMQEELDKKREEERKQKREQEKYDRQEYKNK
jgi:F0F1-type ATP synthase assembly protein I